MLHILWIILKIIAIILAAILGILVLLISIVLFVPLRYQVVGKGGGTLDSLDIKIKAAWLFRLISADAVYHERALKWQVRLGWKKLNVSDGEMPAEEAADAAEAELFPKAKEEIKDTIEDIASGSDKPAGEIAEELKEDTGDIKKEVADLTDEVEEELEEDQKLRDKIEGIWASIQKFFKNIKYTLTKIYDKIKLLIEQKDRVLAFLTDEIHRRAFNLAKKELFRLLKHLRPKRFETKITVGFDDPYNTGRLLAGYSMVYPFIGEHAQLTPDFDHKILEGDLLLKGKIRGIYFLILAWNLFWNKEVRKTYQDIRGFKL